jgi:hypothetical protein
MLQRVQSLFLLFALIGSIILLLSRFTNVAVNADGKELFKVDYSLLGYEVTTPDGDSEKNFPLLPFILNSLVIGATLLCIFLFKKRSLQSTLCRFLLLLTAGFLVALIFDFDSFGGIREMLNDSWLNYLLIVLPILQMLLFFLANKAILKDERLVREADRLR